MPKIDATHPDYDKHVMEWIKCRDVVNGEEAVKAAGDAYLPRLSEQLPEEYKAYKVRALFYGATERTVKSLVGAVFHRPMSKTLPASQEDQLANLGDAGQSLDDLSKTTVAEVLEIGRVGLFVDAPVGEGATEGIPYITTYYAENIINWRHKMINGRKQLILVVLKEEQEKEGGDGFEHECEEVFRVLMLQDGDNGSRKYVVQLWQKVEVKPGASTPAEDEFEQIGDDIIPTMKGGKSLDKIPFQFINPNSISDEVEKSPILDLVNVNLSHYRTSADLEHGRHFTALPVAYAIGFDVQGTSLRVGSATAWQTKNPQAKCGYLEFLGTGLGHLATAMKDKETQMAVLGARVLEEEKATAEATRTVQLRHAGENSVLSSLADSCSLGITQALLWWYEWQGIAVTAETGIKLNKEYDTITLDPAMIGALTAAVIANLMSWDAYFYIAKRAGMYPENIDEETEKKRLMQGPPVKPPGQPAPGDTVAGGGGN